MPIIRWLDELPAFPTSGCHCYTAVVANTSFILFEERVRRSYVCLVRTYIEGVVTLPREIHLGGSIYNPRRLRPLTSTKPAEPCLKQVAAHWHLQEGLLVPYYYMVIHYIWHP